MPNPIIARRVLLGAPAVVVAGGGPAYVFRGSNFFNGASGTQTASIDIGTAAADRHVIVCVVAQNTPTATVDVNGTSLTQRAFDTGNESAGIFDAIVSAGSGSQTVTVTWSSGGFIDRYLFVWTATGLATGYVASGATGGNTLSLTVQPGDFVFSAAKASTPGDWSASDEAPVPPPHTVSTNGTATDWTIASASGSFVIRPGGTGVSALSGGVYR